MRGALSRTTSLPQFVTHIDVGLPEQDVFVEITPGSGKVYRILPSEKENYLDAPVYASADEVLHHPSPDLAGSYQKGIALDMTMQE